MYDANLGFRDSSLASAYRVPWVAALTKDTLVFIPTLYSGLENALQWIYSLNWKTKIIQLVVFVLLIFLVVVATLLMRRYVNPLADVIYAAREVANGKLNTRIPKKGPQDLQSLSESFNEMASSLERSDRERREMLADIAFRALRPVLRKPARVGQGEGHQVLGLEDPERARVGPGFGEAVQLVRA